MTHIFLSQADVSHGASRLRGIPVHGQGLAGLWLAVRGTCRRSPGPHRGEFPEYIQRMQALGLRRFRIDLVRETPEQAVALVQTYQRVLSGAEAGSQTWRALKAMNQLGVTRGTLNLV